jgi:DNA-binding NarL/FixJ family response regulator
MRITYSISIVIADDHEIYRDGLTGLFKDDPRYRILAECRDGDQLLRAVQLHKPEVVITDLHMPRVNGVEAIRIINRDHPLVRVLVLTIMDHEFMIVDALEAGAKGYLVKDAPKQELFEAIDAVYRNVPYYCRHTTAKLVRLISNSYYNPYEKDKKMLFSETEKKIIQLMCEDKSVKEMSQLLFIAERTIEKHRATVFNKMNVKTVAGVAIYAVKHKLYFIDQA